MKLTPDDLSNCPPLSWTEFRLDLGELDEFQGLESTGDGRVLRRIYRGPDMPIRLAATTDGIEWSELPLPNGFQLADIGSHADASIDLAGDRWVAFGHDVWTEPHWTVAEHVWFSDDEGSSWVKASIEVPPKPEPLPPYATEESAVVEALASSDRLIVVVRTCTRLDLDVLLADRGLVPAGKDLVNWVPSADGVTLTFADELPSEAAPSRRGRDRWRLQELEMSYEDLRLSTQQLELLQRRRHTVTRIYSGEGPSLPLTAEYEGWVYKVTGMASPEGIVLATRGEWEALLTSADGLAWDEEPLGSVELWATGDAGALWALARTRKGTQIDRIRYRDGRTRAVFLETVENFGSFSAGPAGVVAAVLTGRSATEPGLMGSIRRATKDGYELHRNAQTGEFTLWDLAADRAVYVFGPRSTPEGVPEGVRDRADDGTRALIFEDPQSGRDLVAFTGDELAAVLGSHRGNGSGRSSEVWVGWSADGAEWGWQSASEAFGVDPASMVSVELAVGKDSVLAGVSVYGVPWKSAPDASGRLEPSPATGSWAAAVPQRWFRARVG